MTDAIIINGRFKHKHDTEENWNKATNFAPLAGETIVYDPDATHPYSRYKTGIWDGKSDKTADMLIMNLPFANQPDTISDEELSSLFVTTYAITRSFSLHLINSTSDTLSIVEILYKPDLTTWGMLIKSYPDYFTATTTEWDKATGKPYIKFVAPYHNGDYVYKKVEAVNPEDPVSVPCTTADLVDPSVLRAVLICSGSDTCPTCQVYNK